MAFSIYTILTGLTDRNELVATADCICRDQDFAYECTVVGENLTVWTILMTGCEITLHHDLYNDPLGEQRGCNGAFIGRSIEVVNRCYRSSLTITPVTPNLNGHTVICSADDGSKITTIGNTTITITEGKLKSK